MEVVWNDDTGATGGGVSDGFSLPAWRYSAGVPPTVNPGGFAGRGLPDVSGLALPHTGFKARVDGGDHVIGGTSANPFVTDGGLLQGRFTDGGCDLSASVGTC